MKKETEQNEKKFLPPAASTIHRAVLHFLLSNKPLYCKKGDELKICGNLKEAADFLPNHIPSTKQKRNKVRPIKN